jgi:hypothetical protein
LIIVQFSNRERLVSDLFRRPRAGVTKSLQTLLRQAVSIAALTFLEGGALAGCDRHRYHDAPLATVNHNNKGPGRF